MESVMKKPDQLLLLSLLARDAQPPRPGREIPSSFLVTQILLNSDKIGPEVKQWAEEVARGPRKKLAAQVQRFWERNAGAFAAKAYDKVVSPSKP
jgi:hypothetical protein